MGGGTVGGLGGAPMNFSQIYPYRSPQLSSFHNPPSGDISPQPAKQPVDSSGWKVNARTFASPQYLTSVELCVFFYCDDKILSLTDPNTVMQETCDFDA